MTPKVGKQGVALKPFQALVTIADRPLWSLSATATLVTGVAIRYKLDGHELERVGVTYVLHKADTGWKIAVLIAHDTEIARQE